MKKIFTLLFSLIMLSLAGLSLSNENMKNTNTSPIKNLTIPPNVNCEDCGKGSFRSVYQNVILMMDNGFVPVVDAKYFQCDHCLTLKEGFYRVTENAEDKK